MSKVSKKTVSQAPVQPVAQPVAQAVVQPVEPVAQPVAQPEPEVQDEKAVVRQTQYEELLTRLEQAQDELG